MPALLEAAANIVLLAFVMLCIAFLMGTKVTLTPVLEVIAALVGKVPLIGDAAKNLVVRAENAVIGALDDAIRLNEAVAAGLWRALVWSWGLMVDAVKDLANGVNSGLDWLVHTHLGTVIAAHIKSTVDDVARIDGSLTQFIKDTTKDIGNIGTRITNVASDIRHDLGADIVTARNAAEHYADTQLTAAEKDLRADFHTIAGDVVKPVSTALNTLKTAEETAVTNLTTAIGNAEAAADAFAKGLVSKTAGELAGLISNAETRALDAEGILTGEVTDVTDHLKALLGDLSFADAAALLASIPALAVLVHTIADESGLGRAETRGKVKSTCAVNPDVWAQLLGGLLVAGTLPSLRELVDDAVALLHEVQPVVLDLVKAG